MPFLDPIRHFFRAPASKDGLDDDDDDGELCPPQQELGQALTSLSVTTPFDEFVTASPRSPGSAPQAPALPITAPPTLSIITPQAPQVPTLSIPAQAPTPQAPEFVHAPQAPPLAPAPAPESPHPAEACAPQAPSVCAPETFESPQAYSFVPAPQSPSFMHAAQAHPFPAPQAHSFIHAPEAHSFVHAPQAHSLAFAPAPQAHLFASAPQAHSLGFGPSFAQAPFLPQAPAPFMPFAPQAPPMPFTPQAPPMPFAPQAPPMPAPQAPIATPAAVHHRPIMTPEEFEAQNPQPAVGYNPRAVADPATLRAKIRDVENHLGVRMHPADIRGRQERESRRTQNMANAVASWRAWEREGIEYVQLRVWDDYVVDLRRQLKNAITLDRREGKHVEPDPEDEAVEDEVEPPIAPAKKHRLA